MTVREMILKNTRRRQSPPESMFEVKTSSGGLALMCYASFNWCIELADLVTKYPDLMEWEVTKEHFTQEELDERARQRTATDKSQSESRLG